MSERRGFTLIELLVVIAIISLLMSVLLPSLRQAKELAKQVYCMSNVRNQATAWALYRSDYEFVVHRTTTDDHSVNVHAHEDLWRLRLSAYAGTDRWRAENFFAPRGVADWKAWRNDTIPPFWKVASEMDLWDCPTNDLWGFERESASGHWSDYTLVNSASNRYSKDYWEVLKALDGYNHNGQHFGGNRFLKGNASQRVILGDGFYSSNNRPSSLALFYDRWNDELPVWNGTNTFYLPWGSWRHNNDPFCWPHLGKHLWDGEASIAFGDGHVEKKTFYEQQLKLVSWDASGRDCEWYMDADESYRPASYSATCGYQNWCGFP